MNASYVPGLISVIIPTYQHADTIAACVDSVLAQTHDHLEVLVVNDGSTDDTLEVLRPYHGRVRVMTQPNAGANPARNRGLKEARGEFVIFVDADVVMRPEMLSRMLDLLRKHADVSFVYAAFTFGWKTFRGVPFAATQLRKRNYIHTTSLVRRLDFPGFDPAIKRLQDWDVWLSMLAAGKKGMLIPDILFHVQIDGDSRIGSQWLPSLLYKIPWRYLPWQPRAIKRYNAARAVIAAKHGL